MARILFCGLTVVVVCFLASEARPTNNARVGMSEFGIDKKEGSYKRLYPRSLRPPPGKEDTILSDESDREKRDYNTHHEMPPGGIYKTMLSGESDREEQDYNLEQRPPPMGSRVKVTLSDGSEREKRDYNRQRRQPPMGSQDKVTSSDESNPQH